MWNNSIQLSGMNVLLEPLQSHHKSGLIEAASDGELWSLKVTAVPNPQSMDDYIDNALEGQNDGSVLPFTIILKQSSKILGSTRFWKMDSKNRNLEIGHTWIANSWQRTFVNTESKYLMLRYAFETLDCVRVQFTTDVLNEHSRIAILRLGAEEEGIIRNERIMPNGRIRDSVRFSIIHSEWSNIRNSLENRLHSMKVNPSFEFSYYQTASPAANLL